MKRQESEIQHLRKIVNVLEPLQHVMDEDKVMKLAAILDMPMDEETLSQSIHGSFMKNRSMMRSQMSMN